MSFDQAQFTRTYDLAYAVVGSTVRVEQSMGMGSDEVAVIDLHKSQVAHLATELGLIQGGPEAWDRVKTLERRFLKLRLKLIELEGIVRSHPIYGGSSKDDDELQAVIAMLDLMDEWCEDLTFYELSKPEEVEGSRKVTPSHAVPESSVAVEGKPTANPRKTQRVAEVQVGLPLEGAQQ